MAETIPVAWSTRLSLTGTSERNSLAHRITDADDPRALCGLRVPTAVRNHLRATSGRALISPVTSWANPSRARPCTRCTTIDTARTPGS